MQNNKMNSNKPNYHKPSQLNEGMAENDLDRLVYPKLHIDEFKSKMGDDADVIVLSLRITDKDPATDLMNFVEHGYDWVLDADISAGDFEEGEYLVFVEMDRDGDAPKRIMKLMSDLMNLTGQDLEEWYFQCGAHAEEHEITEENIKRVVPLTPRDYLSKNGDGDKELAAMQESARVPMNRQAPKNDWTESLRIAAGLK